MHLKLSTTATLGTEESDRLLRGLNKSQCMDCPPKKLTVVRWSLVEVRLYNECEYHPRSWGFSSQSQYLREEVAREKVARGKMLSSFIKLSS